MWYNRGVDIVIRACMGSEVKECKLFMVAEKKLCLAFFS